MFDIVMSFALAASSPASERSKPPGMESMDPRMPVLVEIQAGDRDGGDGTSRAQTRATGSSREVDPGSERSASQTVAIAASTETDAQPSEPTAAASMKKKPKLLPVFEVGGRLMTGWQAKVERPGEGQPGVRESEKEFFLHQARVNVTVRGGEWLRLRITADLSDAIDPQPVPYLRNAYANVRIFDELQLRVGRFKRPFSRMQIDSQGDLPMRGRGLINEMIVEDLQYGDRSVGAMLWGKSETARMRWFVSAFNSTLGTKGYDVIARLQADPWRWLSVGVDGGYKRTYDIEERPIDVWSGGGDVRLRFGEFELVSDFMAGQDYRQVDPPWALGIANYAVYDIDLPRKFELQPVVFFEWADADIGVLQSEATRWVAGMNLIWRKWLRIMPQVEFIRPLGTVSARSPWIERERYYVMLSLQM